MDIIVRPLAELLKFIYNIFNNYGLAIIIFTVLVRACLFPLYYKQAHSMKKMQVVSPKVAAIQNKYKGKTDPKDKQKMQAEIMEVYKEAGTNPAAGCLPLLVQLPILMSLYRAFSDSSRYLGKGVNYHFFGLDLSKAPSHFISGKNPNYLYLIIVILAAGTTFIAFKLFQAPQPKPQEGQFNTNNIMKPMLIFSTFMTGSMALSFPCGMGIYWTTNNVFQLCQQYVLYKRIHTNDMYNVTSKPTTVSTNKAKPKAEIKSGTKVIEETKSETKKIVGARRKPKNNK